MPALPTTASPAAESTAARVAEELRQQLFAGDLTPGTALREVALADAMGVSRPTVREALSTLVTEGLADRRPHRGTIVRALDVDAIEDITRARLVVESAGVRAWATAADGERSGVHRALDAFRALPADAIAADTTEAHLAIHRSVVALTGSARVLAAADLLYAELRLALATVDRQRRDHADQVRSHCHLVDLLESGDTDATLAELRRHLDNGRLSLLAAL
jgi:DNA-binding GntR family transcriptional regulator